MELSIIIINWNSKGYLRSCLDSILEYTSNIEYEIIIVDSGSFDGCGEMLREFYPKVHFIQSDCNMGFARSNNLGAGCSKGKVLLFLNPDTEMRGSAITNLYRRFQSLSNPGVVGCRLLNSDGSLQTSCVQPLPTVMNQILDVDLFQRWFPKVGLWTNGATFGNGTDPVEVEALSGACLMIQRKVFEQVGGFSTDYFMYGEDLDLCYKTRKAGFRNFYVPDIAIVHHGGGSSKNSRSDFSNIMMRESVSRFLSKYRGNWYQKCYRLGLAVTSTARLMLLALFFPIWLRRGRSHEWIRAFWKWTGILRWGIGLEKWIQNYDRLGTTSVGPYGNKGKKCAGSAEN